MSLLVVPAPPAVAATVPDVPAPVVYTPTDTRAAERATRTLNRRVAPPVAQAVAQPVVPVVQKRVKPVVKKPVVKKTAVKPATLVVKKTAPKPAPRVEAFTVPASGRAAGALAYARRQIGKPYVWAAAGPSSFDCSGLIVASFRSVGISLPHQTGSLIGRGRAVSRAQLQPGDLVFPTSSHVGIYVGNGMMIHAPRPGRSVEVAKVYAFYAGRRI